MSKCYFCSRLLEESGFCNNCNILHCEIHFRINFSLIENTINIVKEPHDILGLNILRYYYLSQTCFIYFSRRIMDPQIKFEIKHNQFNSLEQFKKIVEKHLKFSYLK